MVKITTRALKIGVQSHFTQCPPWGFALSSPKNLGRPTVHEIHDGLEVNRINEVNGKKFHDRAFHFVNTLQDFT